MSDCNRFEKEGLEAETLSEEFAEHLKTCKACQQAQTGYENLCQLLGQCQAPLAMPLQWKENVWRAIEMQADMPARKTTPAHNPPTPSLWEKCCAVMRPYRWVLGGMTTATLLGVLFFSMDMHQRTTTTASTPAAFEWSILDVSASQIRNADRAKLGNQIHIQAHIPPASQVALLVYVQNRLVFSCPPATPGQDCKHTRDTLEAKIPLEQLGLYRALWVYSSKPLPMPNEGFELDAAAFLRAGANIQYPFVIEVY